METLESIVQRGKPAGTHLHFNYLPQFAAYLLKNKTEEFAMQQLLLSREIQLPLLKFLEALPEREMVALSLKATKGLLTYFSENRIAEFIDKSLQNWKLNVLPIVKRDDIVADDISLLGFIRRKVFRDLFLHYSSDLNLFRNVMEEVDQFTFELEKVCFKNLFELNDAKLKEHNHFINQVSQTIPGILYVFDLSSLRQVYSNRKLEKVLGYTISDIREIGTSFLESIVHEDDIASLRKNVNAFLTAPDGEMRIAEYRVRSKKGNYHWLRSYETVFKRDENGIPSEVIGISIDVTTEKEIALQLQTREQQLLEAQEIAELGNFEWNIQDESSSFSPQVQKIFQFEENSNLTTFLEYVHPGDRNKVKAAIDKAFKGEGIFECEFRYRINGIEKIIWSRGVVSFENEQPLKMKGTVMDITQRHHMLQELERSEELHKQAQALTHIGNWSWFLSDNAIQWSDELYRIYGLEPQSEVITFERFSSLIHPDDRTQRLQQIDEALETHIAEDYTMRILCEDGSVKVLQGKGQVLMDENDRPYKLIGTCQDVTKQVQLNQELKENEETFRQLIFNAPDAVIMIDHGSNILLWNPKAEEIFGWNDEEVLGKSLVQTIVPIQYRDSHLQGLIRLQTTGESHVLNKTLEITALNKKGEEFYISLSIARSRRAGKPVFISFIRDISKEKKAEAELEESRNQLAHLNESLQLKNDALVRSNRELTSFNYIASHDLQEPLRKIRTFSNRIIEKNDTLTDDTKEFFGRIISSAERMQLLIDDLLSFSRTSMSEKIFEPVDMNAILREVKTSLKHSIDDNKVKITSSQLPTIKGIPFQLHQLLENIFTNAIKYQNNNVAPKIKVSSTIVMGNQIPNVSAIPRKKYYKLSIADNGIGFEDQYAMRIFEPFKRLHGKNEYSGTGIGLAICKKIADNHNGFINAEGKPGIGSVFHVYLPMDDN